MHSDSAGHRGIVYPGLAQRMSAGRGIVHAERNDAYRCDPSRLAEPVRYVQMWLRPDALGGDPSYQQRELDLVALGREWLPVASGGHPDAAVTLATADSTLWATVLPAEDVRLLPAAPLVHLYVARGAVELETLGRLGAGDSVRLSADTALRLTGVLGPDEAELLVWELGS